jgi:hypothetical protein
MPGGSFVFMVALALVTLATPAALARDVVAPTFNDPTSLVLWLIQHSAGRGLNVTDVPSTSNVFSPGLRAALTASFQRSRLRNEPPCGADGDIILETQEEGAVSNLRLSAQQTAPDRTIVAASFDVDGYHRAPRFMTVLLDGAWKVENIVSADGVSLRRALDCRR